MPSGCFPGEVFYLTRRRLKVRLKTLWTECISWEHFRVTLVELEGVWRGRSTDLCSVDAPATLFWETGGKWMVGQFLLGAGNYFTFLIKEMGQLFKLILF